MLFCCVSKGSRLRLQTGTSWSTVHVETKVTVREFSLIEPWTRTRATNSPPNRLFNLIKNRFRFIRIRCVWIPAAWSTHNARFISYFVLYMTAPQLFLLGLRFSSAVQSSSYYILFFPIVFCILFIIYCLLCCRDLILHWVKIFFQKIWTFLWTKNLFFGNFKLFYFSAEKIKIFQQ